MKNHVLGTQVGPFKLFAGIDVLNISDKADKAKIRISVEDNNRSPICYYRLNSDMEEKSFGLSRVEKTQEIEMLISTPLMNSGNPNRVVDGIVLLQFSKFEVIAVEVGVVRVERATQLVTRFMWRSPYALDKVGNIDAEGLKYEPLKRAMEKMLLRFDRERILNPFVNLMDNRLKGKFVVAGGQKPSREVGRKQIIVIDVDMIRGVATGLATLKDKGAETFSEQRILLQLSDFKNRLQALNCLRYGSLVVARDLSYFSGKDSPYYAKATGSSIVFENKKKKEGSADSSKAKEAPKAEVATEKSEAEAVVKKEAKPKAKKAVAPKKVPAKAKVKAAPAKAGEKTSNKKLKAAA